jgi:hypothetical protein
MALLRKKQPKSIQQAFLHLLVIGITAGLFLPFLHFATASHDHHFDLKSGHFSDIVPSDNGPISVTQRMASNGSCRSYRHLTTNQVDTFSTELGNQIRFRYCLSANGILLNQIVSQTPQVADSEAMGTADAPINCPQLIVPGSVLYFAPKHSPPHC